MRNKIRSKLYELCDKKCDKMCILALRRMQNELIQTERLAIKQKEKLSNPANPIYAILLWMQDDDCLKWVKSFEQEILALPARFTDSEDAKNSWKLLFCNFQKKALLRLREYAQKMKKLKICLRKIKQREILGKWLENAKSETKYLQKENSLCMSRKSHIFSSWHKSAQKNQNLRKIYAIIQSKHCKIIKKEFVQIWKIKYYEKIRENQIYSNFLKKLAKKVYIGFRILKEIKKSKENNNKVSAVHNCSNLVKKAMGGWHFLAVYNRKMRETYKKINNPRIQKVAKWIFNEWKTNFKTNHKSTIKRNVSLKKKCIQGFKNYIEYKELKSTLVENCDSKREFNLKLKAFATLRKTAQNSRKLIQLERVSLRRNHEKILQKVFAALGIFAAKKSKKRENIQTADTFCTNTLIFKGMRILCAYAKVRKMRKNNEDLIYAKDCGIKVKSIISEWKKYTEYRKKIKQAFKIVGIKKLVKLSRKALKHWHHKYLKIHKKEVNFTIQKDVKQKKLIFEEWKKVTKILKKFNMKFAIFLQNRANGLMRKSILCMQENSRAKKLSKTHKKIATIFFLDRKMRNILAYLKYQANLSKAVKIMQESRVNKNMRKLFTIWKNAFNESYKLKDFIINRIQKEMKYILYLWNNKAKRIILLRKIIEKYPKFMKSNEFNKLRKVVKTINAALKKKKFNL